MSRLFTFGCSFTNYFWPTWAEILFNLYPGENWALPGGGNKFIFQSLVECIVKNNINKDDIVIIMWSSWAREDRYYKGGWRLDGNVYNSNLYDNNFLKKYYSEEGAIYDSFNWICAAYKMLELLQCKYIITSVFPLFQVREYRENWDVKDIVSDIEKYKNYFDFINKYKNFTVFENMCQIKYLKNTITWKKTAWSNTPCNDNHPTPLDHYSWLKNNILPKLNLNSEEILKLENFVDFEQEKLINLANTTGIHPGINFSVENFYNKIERL